MAKKKDKDRKKKRLYKRKGFWLFNLFCLVAAAVGLHVLDDYLQPYRERAQIYELERINDLEQPSLIFDRHGREIGRMFVENRSVVSIDKVPSHMIEALLAQEDQRYFKHKGVDWIGVVRAVYLIAKAREVTQGASTITMQLARNAFDLKSEALARKEDGFERKLVEAFLALRIEAHLTAKYPGEEGREAKMKMLEYYLNRINFGSGFYGIRSASLGYFGKEPADMTIEECCSLVACVKNPATLSPLRNPEGNRKNRNHVLNRMLAEDMITKEEWTRMTALPVEINSKPLKRGTSHLYERIADQARNLLGSEAMSQGGYAIYTTIDRDVQEEMDLSLRKQLDEVELRPDYAHPKYGDYVKVTGKAPDYLQGAGLVIDSKTGDVVAHVGGRDYVHSQYDFVNSGSRPLGTAYLPFVYAAALEGRLNPSKVLLDEPMDQRAVMIGDREGILGEWGMETRSPQYEGRISARRSLATSKIAATVRLGKEIGLDKVAARADAFGLTRESEELLTRMLVGSASASLPQVVQAYSAFSQEGRIPRRMRYIDRIVDGEGKLRFQDRRKSAATDGAPACDPETAFQIHSILEDVLRSGNLAQHAKELEEGVDGVVIKTGSTHNFSDGWSVGYNGTLTFGMWVGFLSGGQEAIYEGAFGRELLFPASADLMNVIARKFSTRELPVPEGLELVEICSESGSLKTRYCYHEVEHPRLGTVQRPTSYSEFLRVNRSNIGFCEVHGQGGVAVKEVLEVYGPEASSSAERQRLAISPIRPQAPVLVGTDPYNSVTLSLAPKDASRDMLLRAPSLLLDFGPSGDESASLRLRPPPKLNFEIPE